ncbi:hypothetical protein BD779DRAFT_1475114 [Infundibulicybe gibba]|nr:hypothetical protein BD779DRAFT_1475114 [Infundibulicybe gibba]
MPRPEPGPGVIYIGPSFKQLSTKAVLSPIGAEVFHWAAWGVYWWFQGLIFTGIWVIGHKGRIFVFLQRIQPEDLPYMVVTVTNSILFTKTQRNGVVMSNLGVAAMSHQILRRSLALCQSLIHHDPYLHHTDLVISHYRGKSGTFSKVLLQLPTDRCLDGRDDSSYTISSPSCHSTRSDAMLEALWENYNRCQFAEDEGNHVRSPADSTIPHFLWVVAAVDVQRHFHDIRGRGRGPGCPHLIRPDLGHFFGAKCVEADPHSSASRPPPKEPVDWPLLDTRLVPLVQVFRIRGRVMSVLDGVGLQAFLQATEQFHFGYCSLCAASASPPPV